MPCKFISSPLEMWSANFVLVIVDLFSVGQFDLSTDSGWHSGGVKEGRRVIFLDSTYKRPIPFRSARRVSCCLGPHIFWVQFPEITQWGWPCIHSKDILFCSSEHSPGLACGNGKEQTLFVLISQKFICTAKLLWTVNCWIFGYPYV